MKGGGDGAAALQVLLHLCTCETIKGGQDDQELWSSGDFASSPPPAACFQTLLGLCLRLPRK